MESESPVRSLSFTQPATEKTEADQTNSSSLIEDNTSLFGTVFNGLNSIVGPGLLLVPYALASGGWLSIILLLVVAMAATYTGVLIRRCLDIDTRIKSYINIGEHAYGQIGKVIVSIILIADLYMVDTGFLILEGDNLHKLFPKVTMKLFGIAVNGKSMFTVIVAIVLVPTVWLDDLRILAYISATGVLTCILIVGSVLWDGIFDGIGFHHKGELLRWKGLPTSISLYMVSYGSHPVFPTLYTSMQNKLHFSNALYLCFFIASTMYILMAILGYLMFGPGVESQITLNLPTENISSKVAICTMLITPLAKYALLLKPIVSSMESWFPNKYRTNWFFKIIARTLLVVTQVVVALTLPFFGHLMSLVGALLSATASLTIPCLCYLRLSSTSSNRPSIVERIFVCGIVVLSILISITGTYTSVRDLIGEFSH